MRKSHVAVLGAGPGGYAAAFRAADLGLQVTLIDPEANPGGVCLYRGCIPSKALLHVARLLHEAKDAAKWGVQFAPPSIDLDRLRAYKSGVVAKLTGGLGQLTKARQIQYLRGQAKFLGPQRLAVTGTDGEHEVACDDVVVATGSSAIRVPGVSIDSPRVLDSTTALDLPDIPKSLLIVGGGYIGLELGSVYAALGSAVTVVEMLPNICAGADRDLAVILEKRLKGLFKEILVNTKVASVTDSPKGLRVRLEGPAVTAPERLFDRILVSVGRRPNSANLGLETTGAKVNARGFIEVDAQRRTADPHVYAIGDVTGPPMLAHKASHEGFVAVEAIAGENSAFAPAAIPAVVFTDPELAWCGLTEGEAKERGIAVKVGKFPWGASGRATSIDRNDGLTKVIADAETGRVLGVGIVGVNAGEMIAEGALAVEMAAQARDLSLTIHPHPTLSETLMEAAELIYGNCTHTFRPKR